MYRSRDDLEAAQKEMRMRQVTSRLDEKSGIDPELDESKKAELRSALKEMERDYSETKRREKEQAKRELKTNLVIVRICNVRTSTGEGRSRVASDLRTEGIHYSAGCSKAFYACRGTGGV